jgi:hypothetical protein
MLISGAGRRMGLSKEAIMGRFLNEATCPSLSSQESMIFTEAMRSKTPVTTTWVTVLPSRKLTL